MAANDEERTYRYISDINQLAIEKGIPGQDLFDIYTQLATILKINAVANGVPIETIQKIEKGAIKGVTDAYIRREGQHAKNQLKTLGLYDGEEIQVLPTFPSADQILEIDEILKSGKHWVIVTRMGRTEDTLLDRIRHKYYPESDSDYKHIIFAFEEGTSPKKSGGMEIIIAAKSRMTAEQMDNELLPNPETRNKTPPTAGDIHCFLTLDDKDGWNWIDRLNTAMGCKKEMLKSLGLGGTATLTTEEKRSLK